MGRHQSGLSLVCPLPTNTIPAPLAHMLYDSQCTFFLPLFISTPPVALPLKPYGSPLDKYFQKRDISGADSICVVPVSQSREAHSLLLISQMVLGTFGTWMS